MKYYYHATPMENYDSIHEKGILRGCDRVIYLAEEPEEAARFVAIRGYKEILVCKVYIDENLVEESFDHNENFFKCKAYTYPQDISRYSIRNYLGYEIRAGE